MVKKQQQGAESEAASGPAAGLFDRALAGTVRESAQQIWLAGLGAFSKAQAEGGKVFESLVKEGANLQKKTQSAAEEKIGEVTNRMTSMAGDVSARAGQHWDKLESIFEDRTARAMGRLGVPTKKDVEALVERIDALSAKVAALSRTTAAKKAAAKKSATPAGGTRRAPRKRAG
jgi:poly(hydroxyalkanoate) granule-associated protein